GQVLLVRALKILHALRRKSVSTAVSQVDDHPAGGGVEMRGGGARLSLEHPAAARFGPSQLLLGQISHGFAPSPSRTPPGVPPPRQTAASDPTARRQRSTPAQADPRSQEVDLRSAPSPTM